MKKFRFQDVFAYGAGAAVTLFTILLALMSLPAWAGDVEFNRDGALNQPQGYREWPYVGTPLTPNEMNGGRQVGGLFPREEVPATVSFPEDP